MRGTTWGSESSRKGPTARRCFPWLSNPFQGVLRGVRETPRVTRTDDKGRLVRENSCIAVGEVARRKLKDGHISSPERGMAKYCKQQEPDPNCQVAGLPGFKSRPLPDPSPLKRRRRISRDPI